MFDIYIYIYIELIKVTDATSYNINNKHTQKENAKSNIAPHNLYLYLYGEKTHLS